MRIIRSFSLPINYSEKAKFVSLYERMISVKSFFGYTLTKSRVLIRLIFNKGIQSSYADPIPNGLAGKAIRISANSIVQAGFTQTSSERIINQFLNRRRGWLQTIISNWLTQPFNSNLKKSAHLIRNGGLSLGFVGVCVKRNGNSSLLTEQDEVESVCQEIRSIFSQKQYFKPLIFQQDKITLETLQFGNCIAKGCNAVVYDAKLKNNDKFNVNLAVKMMFNYDAESNAFAIINSMNKECVPFNGEFSNDHQLSEWINKRRCKLNSHPNIVEIYNVFADFTPCLQDAFKLYPDALPPRINECGYGRNMTLFLAMKRYDMSLKDYLIQNQPKASTSISMLTQLLEAVDFLVKSNIAHRDLKCDNILVSLEYGEPWLVVTDFGSCLDGLSLFFPTEEICRGGNRALMAPEVITAKPGPFSYINYNSSDLWSIGAIAYELFGGLNPFYSYPNKKTCLQSYSYDHSQLPDNFPLSMPLPIQNIVTWILKRNPKERPTARTAATVCHLVLHSSNRSLEKLLSKNLNPKMLLEWLAELALSTICQRKTLKKSYKLSEIELKLRTMFLSQTKIEHLIDSIEYFD